MKKRWEYINIDIDKVNKLSEETGLSTLISTILINRGIDKKEDVEVFLNPKRDNFYDPFLLKDMDIATEEIIKVIEKKGKILIYGDYDVDGITSIAVLKKYLEERGVLVSYFIPNRLSEGYGLNNAVIENIAKENYDLMITVDTGITAINEIEYANSLGIRTIVTDHHETGEEIPNAIAVVNPKRKDSSFPFNGLAGVGVVFKLIQAISIKLNLDEKEYLKYLDLVCVGTISDIVPLISENRVIAKLGLMLIEKTKNLGLKTLVSKTRYRKFDASLISFGIAPRVNACGRMGCAEDALKLFLSDDINEVNELTNKLEKYNEERQKIEKNIFLEAEEMLKDKKYKERESIVLASKNWNHGVIGIVASKITDMEYKPSILLCIEDGIAKGSGRSIQGLDLHESLVKCSKYLDKFGGHAMAVGLTLKEENIEGFMSCFEEYVKTAKNDDMVPVISIDSEIKLKELSIEKTKELLNLEPFGEGNKTPILILKNVKIDSIRTLSEGKHIKLTLRDEANRIDAIGFNLGSFAEDFLIGDKVDVIGNLELNVFNGFENVQLNIKDMRKTY